MTISQGRPQPEGAQPACDRPATPTIGELWSRRSVRAYTDEPVSPQDERQILLAACQAPTTGNQQLARPKPRRFDLSDVVFEDRYRDPSDDELRDALACKRGHAADHDEWVRAFCERKWNSVFSREMTRSVGVWLDGFER